MRRRSLLNRPQSTRSMYGAASKETAPACCRSTAEACGTADSIIALTMIAATTTLVAAILAASVVTAAMAMTMAGATATITAVAGIIAAFFLYKHRHTDIIWIPWVTAGNTVACREEVGKRMVGLGRLAGLGAGITTTHLKKPPSSSAEGGRCLPPTPPSYAFGGP